jgi:hypothetical protein
MSGFAGYKATEKDGVLVIHNVPIFVECQRGEHNFDKNWISQAVAKAMQAEKEGYLPPLHVRHHTGSQDDGVRPAGFFRIVGTGLMTFKGQPSLAVYADLHITDPSVREEVLSKRLPYRSVEIFDVDAPALDSLALLDHEAPYLELPMLMVADISESEQPVTAANGVASATFYNPWLQRRGDVKQPVVACFRRGSSAILLIEDDINMNKQNKKRASFAAESESYPQDQMEAVKDKPEMGMEDAAPVQDKPEEKMQDEGGMNVAAICDAIRNGAMSSEDIAAIQAALAESQSGGSPETEDTEEAEPVPMAESMKALPAGIGQQMARIAGENAVLRARLDEREAADRRRDDVTVALAKLEGRPCGSDIKERLFAFHKKHGAEAFGEYVDSMVNTFGELDGLVDHGVANFARTEDFIPPVAMKWTKDGPEAVERAARFAREWKDLRGRGLTRQSEERYIELNMSRN